MERRPTTTENKLILLHVVAELGAVTNLQALQFVVENEIMDYIELSLSLAELTDSGLLRKLPHEVGTLYALSARGREALAHFSSSAPHSRRQRVTEAAPPWRERFRAECQQLAEWYKTGGDYQARLRLLEQGTVLMDMTISLPDKDQAQTVCTHWRQDASRTYKAIVGALLAEPPDT